VQAERRIPREIREGSLGSACLDLGHGEIVDAGAIRARGVTREHANAHERHGAAYRYALITSRLKHRVSPGFIVRAAPALN